MAVNTFPTTIKKSRFPLLIVVGIALLIISLLAWYKYQSTPASTADSNDSPTSETSSAPPVVAVTNPEDQAKVDEILKAIATLHALKLDTKFFEDPRFTALKELKINIPEVVPSRDHVFEFSVSNPVPEVPPPTPPPSKKK